MYCLRADHAAGHRPARILLRRPRRACLFLRVRSRGDRICSSPLKRHRVQPVAGLGAVINYASTETLDPVLRLVCKFETRARQCRRGKDQVESIH